MDIDPFSKNVKCTEMIIMYLFCKLQLTRISNEKNHLKKSCICFCSFKIHFACIRFWLFKIYLRAFVFGYLKYILRTCLENNHGIFYILRDYFDWESNRIMKINEAANELINLDRFCSTFTIYYFNVSNSFLEFLKLILIHIYT